MFELAFGVFVFWKNLHVSLLLKSSVVIVFLSLNTLVFGQNEESISERLPPEKLPERLAITEDAEIRKTLTFLRTEMLSNFEKIKTWDCEYEFQDKLRIEREQTDMLRFGASSEDAPLMKQDIGIFHSITNEEGKLFVTVSVRSSRLKSLVTGFVKDFSGNFLLDQRSVLTADMFIAFEPKLNGGELLNLPRDVFPASGRTAYQDPVSIAVGQENGMLLNPRQLFQSGSRYFWEECEALVKQIKDFDGGIKLFSTDRGFETEMFLRSSLESPSETFRTVYDKSCSYNVASREHMNIRGNLETGYYVNYHSIEGVYLPSKTSLIVTTNEGEGINFQRILVAKKTVLNKPVDVSQFSFKAIGLENGDRFVNRVERKGFIYRDGELTSETAYAPLRSPEMERDSKPKSSILFIVLLSLAMFLGSGFFFWKKMKS